MHDRSFSGGQRIEHTSQQTVTPARSNESYTLTASNNGSCSTFDIITSYCKCNDLNFLRKNKTRSVANRKEANASLSETQLVKKRGEKGRRKGLSASCDNVRSGYSTLSRDNLLP